MHGKICGFNANNISVHLTSRICSCVFLHHIHLDIVCVDILSSELKHYSNYRFKNYAFVSLWFKMIALLYKQFSRSLWTQPDNLCIICYTFDKRKLHYIKTDAWWIIKVQIEKYLLGRHL